MWILNLLGNIGIEFVEICLKVDNFCLMVIYFFFKGFILFRNVLVRYIELVLIENDDLIFLNGRLILY